MVTQKRLKELLDYDPITGHFTWRKARVGCRAGNRAGSVTSRGYRRIKVDRQEVLEHRLVFIWMTGSAPDEVDHANRNKADNRWSNLRPATSSQNKHNKPTKATRRGVSFQAHAGRYRATIMVHGRNFHLGYFDDIEDAAAAYDAAALKHFGEFAVVNGRV